jgi:cytochrome b subunit of formate dehydrogenase
LTKEVEGKSVSVYVNQETFNTSVHSILGCTDCHSNVTGYPHDPAPAKVSCAECHAETHAAYTQGLHAKAIRNGSVKAASCLDCHGPTHAILPSSDPASKVHRTNIPQTCGTCHGVKFVMESAGISAQPFFSYSESVHGRAVAAGSLKAAVCTDCHRSHDIRSPADPASPIFKFSVPNTCGQCHQPVAHEFTQSIHGQAISRGNWQAPVCTDCHGIHLIKPHIDPTSSVASQSLARTTCAQCHEGIRLSQEFGVPGKRASTYLDSYHGLASTLGSKVVANCASCHGIHNILPSSDPRSTISKNNLVTTCGKCHPGASENFARGKIHLDVPLSEDIGSTATRWIRWFYLWLIAVTVGSMVAHNVLIWRKKALAVRQAQDRSIVRMTANQRIQHLLLLSSFIVLALTGFALKYPDSWLAWLLGSSETIRSIGHRVAAVVLLTVGIYHVGYILLTKEGRQGLRDMRPIRKDILDLVNNLKYYLGRSLNKPKFGRFGYAEKFEYWALVWGVIIMGVTGLMAWFEVEMGQFLPRWSIDIALAIHFYEAILATLAIIVWHFYQVVFDPDAYPMNWSWWDGRMSVEHFRHEHPLAYEELLAQQEKERQEQEQQQPDEPEEGLGYQPTPASSGND